MGLQSTEGSEARFAAGLVSVIGHADRAAPLMAFHPDPFSRFRKHTENSAGEIV